MGIKWLTCVQNTIEWSRAAFPVEECDEKWKTNTRIGLVTAHWADLLILKLGLSPTKTQTHSCNLQEGLEKVRCHYAEPHHEGGFLLRKGSEHGF